MIKTTYQTPELRDANDNVVQEGSFGKNSPLTNATNDGAFDYILNNLEALHDTIGDSAPTLDGNGHVVEPANLAIGDEDGLRIKNNYLKLSGGNVTGIASFRTDLRMLDNQDNRFGGLYVPASSSTQQYMQLYGGTRAVGDARLTLYPSGDGHFQLLAYSNDGSNSYALQSDNAGNLNWRGYPLAWKKDYLPLAGGTLTGRVKVDNGQQIHFTQANEPAGSGGWIGSIGNGLRITSESWGIADAGVRMELCGKNYETSPSNFVISLTDSTQNKSLILRPDGTFTWGGNAVALAKDYLPLVGGVMTGNIRNNTNSFVIGNSASNNDGLVEIRSAYNSFRDGALLTLRAKNNTAGAGSFSLQAADGTTNISLDGKPNGNLTWGGNQLGLQKNTNQGVLLTGSSSFEFTFGNNICTIIAKRGTNCAIHVVDYWNADSAIMATAGNSGQTLISVTKTANSRAVTITNNSSVAVAVQILRSDITWE